MHPRSLSLPAGLFLLSASALGQTITVSVKEGDAIAGVGLVTTINNLKVNSSGTTVVEADTDAATTADVVLLQAGVVIHREDDPFGTPPGAISSFDGLSINDSGNVAGNLFLRNLTTSTDSGIYFNSVLVFQESAISTAPEFSAGTPYIGWFDAKLNNSNQIFMVASVDDPLIASTVDRALVIAAVDGAGNLLAERVIAKEGDSLPGIAVETIADFSTGPHDTVWNNNGSALFWADLTGSTTVDGVLVRWDGSNLTPLIREGDPSPFAGRNFGTLLSTSIDMNESGEWVNVSDLDGSTTDDTFILKNGTTVIAREGSGLPAIGAFTFTSFGSGAVRISNTGNVFWVGDWNDPDTTRDVGIFRNDQLIVQEGVTMVGGMPIESISTLEDNFAISRDGRYLAFEGNLPGAINTVFLIDFGPQPPVPMGFCFGDGSGTACPCGNFGQPGNGCAHSGNPAGGNLSGAGRTSLSNDTFVLTASGLPANAPCLFFQGTTKISGGLGTVFGDGLRCVAGTVVRLKIVTSDAVGSATYPGAGDPSVSVKGMVAAAGDRHYQNWYRNAPPFCTPDTYNLTNGVMTTWVP